MLCNQKRDQRLNEISQGKHFPSRNQSRQKELEQVHRCFDDLS